MKFTRKNILKQKKKINFIRNQKFTGGLKNGPSTVYLFQKFS